MQGRYAWRRSRRRRARRSTRRGRRPRQLDDVDEPAAPLGAAVGERQHEVVRVTLPGSHRRARRSAPRNRRRSGPAPRAGRRAARAGRCRARGDVGEPVVEAEPLVIHNFMSGARPWLRSLRARAASGLGGTSMPPSPVVICLFGVEGERRGVAARAGLAAVGVDAPSAWQASSSRPSAALRGERSSSAIAAG